jgi:hypothetical protein
VEKTRISIQPLSHPLEEAATLFPIKETSHLRAYKFTPRRLLLIFLSFLFEKIFDGHLPFLGLFGESFQRSPLPQRKAPPCDTVMESSICSLKVHNSNESSNTDWLASHFQPTFMELVLQTASFIIEAGQFPNSSIEII